MIFARTGKNHPPMADEAKSADGRAKPCNVRRQAEITMFFLPQKTFPPVYKRKLPDRFRGSAVQMVHPGKTEGYRTFAPKNRLTPAEEFPGISGSYSQLSA